MKDKIKYKRLKTALIFLTVVVFYLIDRLIKNLFIASPLIMGQKLEFLPFSAKLFINKGIVFGFSLPFWLIFLLSTIFLIGVCCFAWQSFKNWRVVAFFPWLLILIGGFSNLLDRFIYAGVVDWWEMPWGAVINLADIYIFAGAIGLLFLSRKRV